MKLLEKEPEVVVAVDPEKIDKLISLLHEADPTGEKPDSEELIALEGELHRVRLIHLHQFYCFINRTSRSDGSPDRRGIAKSGSHDRFPECGQCATCRCHELVSCPDEGECAIACGLAVLCCCCCSSSSDAV